MQVTHLLTISVFICILYISVLFLSVITVDCVCCSTHCWREAVPCGRTFTMPISTRTLPDISGLSVANQPSPSVQTCPAFPVISSIVYAFLVWSSQYLSLPEITLPISMFLCSFIKRPVFPQFSKVQPGLRMCLKGYACLHKCIIFNFIRQMAGI